MFTSNSYPLKKRPVLMEQDEPVDLSVKKDPIKEYRPPTPVSRTPSPVSQNISESVPLYRPFEAPSETIITSTKCTPEELNQYNPTNWHQSAAAPAVPYMAYHPYLHGQNAYPMYPQQTPPRSESLSPYSQRESSLSPPAPTYSSLIPAAHFDYTMRQESQAFHSSHRYAPYSPYSGQLSPASSSSSNSERSFTNHSVTSLIEADACASPAEKDISANSDCNASEKSASGHRYQCNDCGKSYLTYSGLTKHQQFHCPAAEGQVKKTFSCNDCDKVYTSLGALKMHIRTHTLPCKCPICGKAFSRPWLLQGHIRTHTGEKPFSCQHCTRSFADRSNLRAHLQTHSDIKKYSCTTCQKSFSRMSLLSKHNENGCPGQTHVGSDYLN